MSCCENGRQVAQRTLDVGASDWRRWWSGWVGVRGAWWVLTALAALYESGNAAAAMVDIGRHGGGRDER